MKENYKIIAGAFSIIAAGAAWVAHSEDQAQQTAKAVAADHDFAVAEQGKEHAIDEAMKAEINALRVRIAVLETRHPESCKK